MATINKNWNFVNDTEGWVSPTAAGYILGLRSGWSKRHKSGNAITRRTNYSIDEFGGLNTSMFPNYPTNLDVVWTWSGTWEDLGVPIGAIVTSVVASQYHRWICYHSRNLSTINLTSTDTKIGPLELYNGATLKSTFLNGIPPTVDRSGDWKVDPPYAAGSAIGNYAPGFTANTGISVSIPSDMHSSSQSFILKNHIILPTPSGGWAKARITRIQLAIDYTITSTDPGLLLACI